MERGIVNRERASKSYHVLVRAAGMRQCFSQPVQFQAYTAAAAVCCKEGVAPTCPCCVSVCSMASLPPSGDPTCLQSYYVAKFICDIPLRVGQGLLFG